MDRIRLGVVGCGRVATLFHLKAIRKVDAITVTAVVDVDEARVREALKAFGADRWYTNYVEMLEEDVVDAVLVATPPRFHGEISKSSVKAGKHVMCEKPLAESPEECLEIGREASARGVKVLPAHNYVFTPIMQKAKTALEVGLVGELERMECYMGESLKMYGSKTDFRLRREGGVIDDLLPHILSIATYLHGPPTRPVWVRASRKNYPVPDEAEVAVELVDGVELHASLSWNKLIPSLSVRVKGARGLLEMELSKSPSSMTLVRGGKREKIRVGGLVDQYLSLMKLEHPSFIAQYEHFVRLIRGEEGERITVEDESKIVAATVNAIKMLKKCS